MVGFSGGNVNTSSGNTVPVVDDPTSDSKKVSLTPKNNILGVNIATLRQQGGNSEEPKPKEEQAGATEQTEPQAKVEPTAQQEAAEQQVDTIQPNNVPPIPTDMESIKAELLSRVALKDRGAEVLQVARADISKKDIKLMASGFASDAIERDLAKMHEVSDAKRMEKWKQRAEKRGMTFDEYREKRSKMHIINKAKMLVEGSLS